MGDAPQQELISTLTEEDFTTDEHRAAWAAILSLATEGSAIDEQSVAARSGLRASELCEWSERAPVTTNAGTWGESLRTYSGSRRLLAVMEEQAAAILKRPGDPETARGAIEAMAQVPTGARERWQSWSEIVDSAIAEMQAEANGATACLPTGLGCLDAATGGGLRPGQVVVLAGRPGTGKSTLAVQIALSQAKRGASVFVASAEMSAEEIVKRSFASESQINGECVRRGTLTSDGWAKVLHVAETMRRCSGLYIRGYGDTTAGKIKADALRHKALHGLDCVMVDYLQLLQGSGATRYEQVSKVSRELKNLAMELRIPVVALAQLRRPEKGDDSRRPTKSDLRDSGQIEQDADLVLLLWSDPKDREKSSRPVELIVDKQRSGATPTIELLFDGPTFTFHEM